MDFGNLKFVEKTSQGGRNYREWGKAWHQSGQEQGGPTGARDVVCVLVVLWLCRSVFTKHCPGLPKLFPEPLFVLRDGCH